MAAFKGGKSGAKKIFSTLEESVKKGSAPALSAEEAALRERQEREGRSWDRRIMLLVLALLCMGAFYYFVERPEPAPVAGPSAPASTTASSGRVEAGPKVADSSAPADSGSGQPAKSEDEINDELIARARQLQEEKLSRELGANPRKMNGMEISDARIPALTFSGATVVATRLINCDLSGLTLENVELKGLTFHRVLIKNAKLKNVSFTDCVFENSSFEDSVFENCRFKGGEFRQVAAQSLRTSMLARIKDSKLDKVLFDDVGFNGTSFEGLSGKITLQNITRMDRGHTIAALISGDNLELTVTNSKIVNRPLANLGNNVTLRVSKTQLERSEIRVGQYRLEDPAKARAYLENCTLGAGSKLTAHGLMILRDCKLAAQLEGNSGSVWYLDNCEYRLLADPYGKPARTTLRGYEDTSYYLLGDGDLSFRQHLHLTNAGFTLLRDLALEEPSFRMSMYPGNMANLQLRNVRIHGGDMTALQIKDGQWEQVAFYPSIKAGGKMDWGYLKVKDLSMPEGRPWQGEALELPRPARSLKWEEVKIPEF